MRKGLLLRSLKGWCEGGNGIGLKRQPAVSEELVAGYGGVQRAVAHNSDRWQLQRALLSIRPHYRQLACAAAVIAIVIMMSMLSPAVAAVAAANIRRDSNRSKC